MKLAAAYLTVVAIWSTTPLAMKWSMDALTITEAAGIRTAVGALICALLLAARRTPIPLDRMACLSYASAVLGIFGAMLCAFWAVRFIPTGLVSVMFGLSPLFTGVFAWPILGERALGGVRLLGVLIAMGGLATVFHSDLALGPGGATGLAAAVAGAALFSLSSVLVKRTSTGIDAIAHTTASLWCSLPFFALAWWLFDGSVPTAVSARSVGAVLYLGVFASTLGFVVFLFVLRRMTAARVALIPLITPVMALMLGAALAGEQLPPSTVLGAGLILLGLFMYEFSGRLWRRPRTRVAP